MPKATPSQQAGMEEEHDKIVAESPEQPQETGSVRERPSPGQIALSIEGIKRAAGSWADTIDAEAFKAYIRERRRSSSRPPVKFDSDRQPMVSDRSCLNT